MKALHVLSSIDPRVGGPARALVGLTAALARQGVEVSIAATWSRGDDHVLADSLSKAGISVFLIGPCRGARQSHPDLASRIRELTRDADIVHIHALWEAIQHLAARSARSLGVPYVFRPCGMLDPWSLRQSRFKKRVYLRGRLLAHLRKAAALHFTARVERDRAAPLGLPTQAIVEPNGIDLAEFAEIPDPRVFRRRFPQVEDKPIVLFLGRVHPKKGIELLLGALAALPDKDSVLVVAGPAPHDYAKALRLQVRALSLERRVLFTGMLDDQARLEALAAASVFVLASEQENFGIAVVEALAAGTPVIISDRVNIASQIEALRLVSIAPLAVADFAAAISRWLAVESRNEADVAAAQELVQRQFEWNGIAARWVHHYFDLAGSGQSQRQPVDTLSAKLL